MASLIFIAAILLSLGGFNAPHAQSRADICGDADGDQMIAITDAVFLVNYIFGAGPAPDPLSLGDCDLNGEVGISDAVWLVNYLFLDGPAPCEVAFSFSPFCQDGRPLIEVTNNEEEMETPESYKIFFENGDSAAGSFQLQAGEIDTIEISNMYGSGVFRIDATGYQIRFENCLSHYVDSVVQVVNFNDYITDPAFEDYEVDLEFLTCYYDFYLDSLTYTSASATLTPTATGVEVLALYLGVAADFEVDGSPFLCPDGTGSFVIDSLLVGSELIFDVISSDSVDVSFDTTATVIMFEAKITLEGALATLAGPEHTVVVEDATSPLGEGMVALFYALIEPLFESILVP